MNQKHNLHTRKRLDEYARELGITVKEFTAAHWWVDAGFNARGIEMFWKLSQVDREADLAADRQVEVESWRFAAEAPYAKTPADFLNAAKGDKLERFRGVGKLTIKESLAVLGYTRRRTRCKECGALTTPAGHAWTLAHRGAGTSKTADLYELFPLRQEGGVKS